MSCILAEYEYILYESKVNLLYCKRSVILYINMMTLSQSQLKRVKVKVLALSQRQMKPVKRTGKDELVNSFYYYQLLILSKVISSSSLLIYSDIYNNNLLLEAHHPVTSFNPQ